MKSRESLLTSSFSFSRIMQILAALSIAAVMMFGVLGSFVVVQAQSDPTLPITKDFGGTKAREVESGEEFTYYIAYRCASITDNCVNATITDPLPPEIDYVTAIGPVSDIANISYDSGAHEVTIDFVDPLAAGKTGVVEIMVKFPPGTLPGTTAVNKAFSSTDGGSEESNEVTATALGGYEMFINKTHSNDIDDGVIGDQFVTNYTLQVCNPDDRGGVQATAPIITDTLPIEATFISASDGGIYDPVSHTITWTNVTLPDPVPVIDGCSISLDVAVSFHVDGPDGLPATGDEPIVGNNVLNNMAFSAVAEDTLIVISETTPYTVPLIAPYFNDGINKSASSDSSYTARPTEELVNNPINYNVTYRNAGTITSTNVVLTDTVPTPIFVTDIGIRPAVNPVSGFYQTVNNPVWQPFPNNSYSSYTNVAVTTTATADPNDIEVAVGDQISLIRWDVGEVALGGTNWSVNVSGIISANTPVSSTFNNCVGAYAEYEDGTPMTSTGNNCAPATVIDTRAIPRITKSASNSSLRPSDVTLFTINAYNASVAHNNIIGPITVADLLPERFEIVVADVTEQSGYRVPNATELANGDWFSFSSTDGAPAPTFTITSSFNTELDTLLRWTFPAPYEQAPGEGITLSFYARVAEFTRPRSVANEAIYLYDPATVRPLACDSSDGNNSYTDTEDLDGDGNTTETGCMEDAPVQVTAFLAMESQKFVQGIEQSGWVSYSNTIAGGDVDYRLVITNTSNVTATNIVAYDIFPHVGDTGVIDPSNRQSEWAPHLIHPITDTQGLNVVISYSQSENPCRPEVLPSGPKNCEDDWSTTPPWDITTVKALRFDFCDATGNNCEELPPDDGLGGGSLAFEWDMVAPNNAVVPEVAWNSFGFYAEGETLKLLPSEPVRVGIEVVTNTYPVSIGDYVWLDVAGQQNDGIQQPEEEGLRGVRVELWNSDTNSFVDFRTTGPDAQGNPGFYQFVAIPDGNYFIRFFQPQNGLDYTFSPGEQGADSAVDSDGVITGTDGTYGDYIQTNPFTISGADNFTLDQGMWLETDYGDAASMYPVAAISQTNPADAARHIIVDGVSLGSGIDGELDGQASGDALGDDDADTDDEDGVVFDQIIGTSSNPSGLYEPGEYIRFTVTPQISTTNHPVISTTYGYLSAWIDYNLDGDWDDTDEQILSNEFMLDGFTQQYTVTVPLSAVEGTTYARFRLSTEPVSNPTGTSISGEVEDYKIQIMEDPVKTRVRTSEDHTSGSNVAIGEIVRYNIRVPVPEGTVSDFDVVDLLPDGLQYLDDGSVVITSTADTSITWTQFVLDPAGPYTSGDNPTFDLGDVTNNDNDADIEYIFIEFNALVLNEAGNNAGDSLNNSVIVYFDSYSFSSFSTSVNIVEPDITIDKTLPTIPEDVGDLVVYQLVATNGSGANVETGFDVAITDTIDSMLDLQAISIDAPGYALITDTSDIPNNSLDIVVDRLDPGDSVTVLMTATVPVSVPVGQTITNTGYLLYSSLPLTSTVSNPTGSTTPGDSGDSDGERNGDGGTNDHFDDDDAVINLNEPLIDKSISPTNYTIGETLTYTVMITLPEGTTTGFELVDDLPAGLGYISHEVITTSADSDGLLAADFSGVLATPVVTATGGSGDDLTLYYGDTAVPIDSNDMTNNSFLLEVTAVVLNELANQAGDSLDNIARLNYIRNGSPRQLTDNAIISLIEPVLSIDKSIRAPVPSPLDAGTVITYDIVLSHDTALTPDAFDVVITDTFPGELINVNVESVTADGITAPTSDLTGNVLRVPATGTFDLPQGAVVTVTVSAELDGIAIPGQEIVNRAGVTWSSLDGTPPEERDGGGDPDGIDPLDGGGLDDYETDDPATFAVDGTTTGKTLLSTSAAHTAGSDVTIGEVLTYSLNILVPEGTIPDLTVVDDIPAGLEYISGTLIVNDSGFGGTLPAGVITATAGSGGDLTLSFGSFINPADNNDTNNAFNFIYQALVLDEPGNIGINPPGQTDLTNGATVTIGTSDPEIVPGVTVTVVEPSMVVAKAFNVEQASPNDTVTVTLQVTNTGTSDAFEVIVQDPVDNTIFENITEAYTPPGFSYGSAVFGDDTILTYTGGDMAVGETITFTFSASLIPTLLPSPPDATNVVTVTQATTLPGPDPNERDEPDVDASDDLTIVIPDLVLDKDDGLTYVDPGDRITYTLSITNVGGATATGVVITETVPADTTFAGPAGWSCLPDNNPGSTCLYTVGTLAANGGTTAVEFSVLIDNPLPNFTPAITNTATTGHDSTKGFDPTPPNNTDDDSDIVKASIGNYVWHDLNADGIQDGGEPGLSGVTVVLYDATNSPILTTTTSASGFYTFTSLIPDDYSVRVTAPAGYEFSPQDQGGDDDVDSDANSSGEMAQTTLSPGENDMSWDAGLFQRATLGNLVWYDHDNDGVQDGGFEIGLYNVTVDLYDGTNTLISTTTTSATGFYTFTGLIPGDYYIDVTPPTGYVYSPKDQGGDDAADSDLDETTGQSDPTTLISGETDLTWDGGLYADPAAIGNYVWLDADQDGIQDSDEYGILDVTVDLYNAGNALITTTTTSDFGIYGFSNLPPGDYYVDVTPPAGYTVTTQDAGADDAVDSDINATTGETVQTTLDPNETDPTWDAGLYIDPASIGNYVWLDADQDNLQDGDEYGIHDVTVELYNSNDVLIDTTTTSATGFYSFTNLPPGDYYLDFTTPAGYSTVTQNVGGNDAIDSDYDEATGETTQTTLTTGEDDLTWDAGYYIDPASIGDYVWLDADQDGLQEATELGIPGVTVELYDGLGNLIDTTTTAGDGSYSFVNLPPRDYYIDVMPPAGYTIVTQDVGVDDTIDSDINATTGETITTTLSTGEDDPTWDAGLYIDPASLGDRVWLDADQDGIQEAGEYGVPNVTVDLYHSSGVLISTTTTSPTGIYTFTNIAPGDYYIDVTPPAGYTIVPQNQGADDAVDSDINATNGQSDTINLTSGENDITWDGGIYIDPASIGNFVWLDADQDGVQDSDEYGIRGVTVDLYDDGDNLIGTTTTDGNGGYSFTNLPPNDYYLDFTTPSGGYITVSQDQGGDDALDSDYDVATGETVTTTLSSGEDDLTWDAGYYVDPAAIGNYIWLDADQDGIQDSDEYGIKDVTVNLYDSFGTLIDTTTTDTLGGYGFDKLPPADYHIDVVPPAGYTIVAQDQGGDDGVDSDIDPANGESDDTTLSSGETDLTWDGGLYIAPATLGNYVWLDADQDDVQDADEYGIPGVTVELYHADGTLLNTTTTSPTGFYAFGNLPPDDYYLDFTTPVSYVTIGQDVGADDAIDSDYDPATGETISTTLTAGESDLTWDAGYYADPASIGNYVWLDADQDGLQEATELGIPGVTVELYDSGDNLIGTTTTAGDGSYSFFNLPPRDYYIEFTTPAGYATVTQDVGADDTIDSDYDVATGQTVTTTLSSGEDDLTWDAGYYIDPASLGDRVWLDADQDGIQEAGEYGVPNVTVDLYHSSGVLISTTTTSPTGIYTFTNIAPGDYYVDVTPPAGYTIVPQDQGADDAADSDINATTGQTAATTLTSGENDITWDGGIYIDPASIGNYVWLDADQDGIQDSDEYGIRGVTVDLYESGGTLIATTTTDGLGGYSFTNLPPEDYYLDFTTPSGGYITVLQDQGGDDALDSDYDTGTGETIVTTLISGENDLTWDAGYYVDPAAIGNYVWLDANQDGIQDSDEYGIKGVTVNLYDSFGTLIDTTTTDTLGNYGFDKLPPADYHIDVVPPAGYTIVLQDQGGDDAADSDIDPATGESDDTTLSSGETDLTWDGGLYIDPATLGNYAWLDADQDGIQDANEYGLHDVTVELYHADGTLLGSTTTSATGLYSFGNLPPDDYYVDFTTPAGYTTVTQDAGANDALDSDYDVATGETISTTLTSNENDTTWDGGFYIDPASIGDYVWLDADQDGLQEATELGIPGVTVELYDGLGNLIDTTTTAGDGSYSFVNLPPRDYYIDVTPPAGYTIVTQDVGADDTIDSDINATTGETITTTLSTGEDDPTWDAGLYIDPASLGDRVWLDADQDGIQEAGEYGVPNVTVDLYHSSGVLISTTTTSPTGIYTFTNIAPGDYYIDVTPPAGYTIVPQNQGADDAVDSDINATNGQSDTINLTSGENDITWDGGIYIDPASIGNFVWLDADQDGVQDSDEYGIRGVTVDLYDDGDNLIGTTTTDGNGGYSFTNLPPNDYYLDFTTPSGGYITVSQDQGGDDALDSDYDTATGETVTTTLSSGEDDLTWDAGYYVDPAAIGDKVWFDVNQNGIQDTGEYGIKGATVSLYDSFGTLIDTTTTDTLGNYGFDKLPPADYYIDFTTPAGYSTVLQNQGGDDALDSDYNPANGETITTTLSSGETELIWDGGFYIDPAEIGNYVWLDADQDGIQDADEYGIPGVTVDLYEADGTFLATTTTGPTGLYTFNNLPPGDYYVDFTTPAGYITVTQDVGGNDAIDSDYDVATGQTVSTTLTSGENDTTWDAGYYIDPASIGDYVWLDADQDGLQEATELGIPGVTVDLYDSNDNLIGTTTTAGDGSYSFTNLPPNDYYLDFTTPAGYSTVTQDVGADDAIDSDYDVATGQTVTTTLSSGEDDLTWDAGYYIDPASLGDRVWLDADQDGIQEVGEYGVPNVSVELYHSSGVLISTTTTSPTGIYTFTNIAPGDYYVDVTPPAGYTIVTQDAGANDALDSDISPTTGETISTTLTSGENDITWDGGIYIDPASIGNYVWLDVDQDGIQQADENGIGNVTVDLYDSNDNLIGTTTTAGDGSYSFTNLPPGDYYLDFTTPSGGYVTVTQDAGADDTIDSDYDTVTGETITTTLSSGEDDLTWDAGYYIIPASIGDTIWFDADQDGIQDAGELGVKDVTVNLYDSADTFIRSTTTDALGNYSFINLAPGDYHIDVIPPAGYTITLQDQGADDTADSDIDPATGESIDTSLASGENDITWDGGIHIAPASIGNYVWLDADQDGLQDAGEYGIPGVTVDLYSGDGTYLDTTTTGSVGNYIFTDLPPGDYYVDFTTPAGYSTVTQDVGGDDTIDSDYNVTTGETVSTTLSSVENDTTWDAGFYIDPASIGDTVWLDADQDGIQDATELGIPGVTVELYDSNDVLIGTTTTAGDGSYSFTNLPPNDYYIDVTPPAGYTIVTQDAGADDAVDSDISPTTGQSITTTLTSGEDDPTWDGGLYIAPASIGDTVWLDADQDGIQEAGEYGVPNVTVELYHTSGVLISTTTTSPTGLYSFTNIAPGDYYIDVTPPAGYTIVTQDAGADDAVDSDISPTTGQTISTTLTSGENDITWDGGIYIDPAAIGNYVWLDANQDGVQDADELGIRGVTVNLYDSGDNLIGTTTTDGNGAYGFTNLPPNDYYLDFVTPVGYATVLQDQGGDDTADSDYNPANGETGVTALSSGENDPTWDAGYYIDPASIGDRVWLDANQDGIQDTGEYGIKGVTVELYDSFGTLVDTTTTDTSGNYSFTNLPPADYYVDFTTPAGYSTVLQDQGGDDTADSDYNPANGQTVTTTLSSNENDVTWDAGYYIDPASIGDRVWLDADQDGIQEAGEYGIPGVTVALYEADGTLIATTTTDSVGNYSFTNLPPADYYVDFTTPAGYGTVTQDAGADNTVDSDYNVSTGETVSTTLTSGENDVTWDAGYYIDPASIGNYVWLDADQDGVQDATELGIPGVTVELYDSNDVLIGTTTTAGDGSYSFTNLPPNDYYLDFTTPAGYSTVTQDAGVDDAVDSDYDVATGQTVTTTLLSGEDDLTWDAGYYIDPASLGNYIWLDANQDGIQDSDEYGIPNVTVELYDSSDVLISTTTTSDTGLYLFSNLAPGDYHIDVTPPAGYTIVTQDAGADDAVDSDINTTTGESVDTTLTSGENDLTWDGGLYIDPAAIGNYVWLDADQDGVQEAGEFGIPNVTVELYSANDVLLGSTMTNNLGQYSFTNLPPNDYYIDVTPPAGFTIVTQDAGADDTVDSDISPTTGQTITTTLTSGENDTTWDGGLYAQPASIGDTVWLDADQDGIQDAGEFGIKGVTVELYDSSDTLIDTTTTDTLGNYSFTNLVPGDYYVDFTTPAGYSTVTQDAGADDTVDSDYDIATGQTVTTTLISNENDVTWDAGYYIDPASIGNYVWLDADQDGIQDAGELGISGVTVQLYEADGTLLATTTTDGNGAYSFTGLPPADYYVDFTTPAGYSTVTQDAGADDAADSDYDVATGETISTTLSSNENDTTWDAGYYIAPASIGNYVWLDADQDGIQEPGENGIPNVTVELYNSNDTLIDTTTTDNSGLYSFTNLPPGDYYVDVTPPAGYTIVTQDAGADDTIDSDINPTTGQTITTTLTSGENDTTWDGGLYILPATLGNYVWLDANQDGIQDGTEYGVADVTVELYDSSNLLISTTTTSATGLYLFSNLVPGDYYVDVTPPAGYSITLQDQGANDAADSDISPTTGQTIATSLTSGENDLTWDGGLYTAPASLGDYIWLDADQDGIQDSDEFGIPNVTVELYDSSDNLIGTTTTDQLGAYGFTNLVPGDYYIDVTPPSGYTITLQDQGADDTADSDISPTTGQTITTTLTSGENDPTWDGGLYAAPASIGDTVWLDANQDGIQDSDEYGIKGVTVELYDSANTLLDTTTTDATGQYSFTNLPPGDYYVDFTTPAGYSTVTQDAGVDDAADSDYDPATGQTVQTTLTSGENDTTWDAGYYIAPASIGNYVWLDADQDGIQDSDEHGISGVTVELFDVDGTSLGTTTTDSLGQYGFSNLPPGDYYVGVTSPAGYTIVTQDAGADDTIDSDISPTTGETISTTLSSGENDPTWDAGLYINPASIGNYVWLDADLNGIQDTDESGIQNVTVRLYDSNDVLIDTTATDADGLYSFTNLPPNDYYIEVVLPANHIFTDQDQGADDTADSDVDTSTGRMIQTTLTSGENDLTWDAGLVPTVARLGDTVWEDLDGDGIQDVGEPGVSGVTVVLLDVSNSPIMTTTTNAVGFYEFDQLAPGDYSVEFTLPAGYDFTLQDQGADDELDSDADTGTGRTVQTTLVTGENDPSWDAGLVRTLSPTLAHLGNYVWEDLNSDGLQGVGEPGVAGITVTLTLSGTGVISTTTTDTNGLYEFLNLTPADYSIEFTLPVSYTFTSQDQGADDTLDSDADPTTGQTITTTLTAGENDVTWDAGIIRTLNPTLAAIGNYVWYDSDRDGVQDISESGIENVTVNLYDTNGVLTDTVQTDASGLYQFTDLTPGDYFVEFVPPTGHVISDQDQGGDDALDSDAEPSPFSADFGRTITTTLTAGENDVTWDAGMYLPSAPTTASLGDTVWLDADIDGVQDIGETGVVSVTVNLYNNLGVLIDTTQTDASGNYGFTNLLPGDYSVGFIPPSGYAITSQDQGVDDEADSDANPGTGRTITTTLTAGENDPSWDAGLFEALRLGNLIWHDENNDGLYDSGSESPVEGVVVELLNAAGNPYISLRTGLPLTTTTNVSGTYMFEGLPQGIYSVRVAASNFDDWTDPLYGYVSSQNQAAVDPATDPDTDPTNNDDDGRNNDDPRMGGITSYPVTLTLGAEPTTEGSDEDGNYDDNDSNLTVDFGFFELLTLGNRIWFDTNDNGSIDGGEVGVSAGVVVELLDVNGDPVLHPITNQPITTTTRADGYYQFTNLYPAEYRIRISPTNFLAGGLLEGYESSTGSVDPDDNMDSDDNGVDVIYATIDGITSDPVTLVFHDEPDSNLDSDDNDNTNLSVDFGVVAVPTSVELISFTASPSGDAVVLSWETAAEIDNLGFRLMRNTELSFAGATEIHFEPSSIGTGIGSSYSFTDSGLSDGTYYYWLVDVETTGAETIHGPVTAEVARRFNVFVPLVIR